MKHRSLRGTILYTSAQPERLGAERDRGHRGLGEKSLFLRGAVGGYMQTRYELVQLEGGA